MSFRYLHYKKGEQVGFNKDIDHIIYLLKGTLEIEGKEIRNFKLNPNELLLLSPLLELQITILADSEVLLQNVALPYYVCERIHYENYQPFLEKPQLEYQGLEIRKPLLYCIHSVVSLTQDEVCCDYMTRAKMQEIFLLYRHYYTTEELIGLLFPLNKRMEFHFKVMVHRTKAHNVKELAALCGYSMSTFKVLFNQCFEHSPKKWMNTYKTEKIKMSLLDPSIPLKAIVSEYGFSDQSQLNGYCKENLGGTAAQIRKKLNKK